MKVIGMLIWKRYTTPCPQAIAKSVLLIELKNLLESFG